MIIVVNAFVPQKTHGVQIHLLVFQRLNVARHLTIVEIAYPSKSVLHGVYKKESAIKSRLIVQIIMTIAAIVFVLLEASSAKIQKVVSSFPSVALNLMIAEIVCRLIQPLAFVI